jgi:hypothetical protein
MEKHEIPSYYENFMAHYNPSTEIGTSEFFIRTSVGIFRMREETVAHCLIKLYNTKVGDFKVFGYELIRDSNKK